MKLTNEQRKLLETVPLSVLTDVARRRREIEKLERRIEQGKRSIEKWEAKIKETMLTLKTLKKLELDRDSE